ncbi:hypothetical protein WP50_17380 [Lactiplantibacillus plantarum]|nr:hypothetical protein WP50_17380 [Lactiplantibacillus plantarum]
MPPHQEHLAAGSYAQRIFHGTHLDAPMQYRQLLADCRARGWHVAGTSKPDILTAMREFVYYLNRVIRCHPIKNTWRLVAMRSGFFTALIWMPRCSIDNC